jgi:hypothetical protein
MLEAAFAMTIPLALLVSGCGCNDFRTTAPRATPPTPCIELTATTAQRGSATCAQAMLRGTNRCSEPLVFREGSVNAAERSIAPGAAFAVDVPLPAGAASYPMAYAIDATVGAQPVRIEFEVIEER